MEGFLHKKGRGESTFGRRTWKKRWFVLDGQYLTYYDTFDTKIGKPVGKKGTFLMKGCDIKVTESKERPCSFAIVADGQTPIFLDAEDKKIMKIWMNALKSAAMGIYGLSKRTDFTEYYSLLGIPEDKDFDLTIKFLTKQYRRISLKAHPDKGGDVDEYERIQEAYNLLKSHLEEEEQALLYDTIHYEVVVEKGGPGIGLGMMVIEDKKKAQISISKVQENIIVRHLDDVAMRIGDVLVGIDDDNTVTWTLARVVQRLNDFRLPVGSTVRLTFARMVRKDGQDDAADEEDKVEGQEEQQREQDDNTAPPVPAPPPGSPAAAPAPAASDDYFASPAPKNQRPVPRSNAPNYNAPTVREPKEDTTRESNRPASDRLSDPFAATQQDGFVSIIAYESVKAVNAELTEQVENLQAQLRAEQSGTEKLKADVVALSTACKKLKKEEMRLKLQIQQLMSNGGGTVSEDQMTDSMQNVANVAGHIQSGQSIPQSPETQRYLDMIGAEAAQRNAISAAAAVDPTGTVLKKWALSGDPAMSKLSRLEERLRKMQESNVPFSGSMSSSQPPPPPPPPPPHPPVDYGPNTFGHGHGHDYNHSNAHQHSQNHVSSHGYEGGPGHGHGHGYGHQNHNQPVFDTQSTLTASHLHSPPRQKPPVPTQKNQRY